MAMENTEPKSKLILGIALGSVTCLVATRYLLVSYFEQQMALEYDAKVGSYKAPALSELKGEAEKMLRGGAMPIDKAVAFVSSKPRSQWGEGIAPKQSADTAAVVGWGLKPRPAPTAAQRASDTNAAVAPTDGTAPAGSAAPGGAPSAAPGATPAGSASAAPASGAAPGTPPRAGGGAAMDPTGAVAPASSSASAMGVTPTAGAPTHRP
jgi:hypothetical protein